MLFVGSQRSQDFGFDTALVTAVDTATSTPKWTWQAPVNTSSMNMINATADGGVIVEITDGAFVHHLVAVDSSGQSSLVFQPPSEPIAADFSPKSPFLRALASWDPLVQNLPAPTGFDLDLRSRCWIGLATTGMDTARMAA